MTIAGLVAAPLASAAPAPAMTVVVHPASGSIASYFELTSRPGVPANAGSLEIENRSARPTTVMLDPVAGLTASTLGSAYATRGSAPTGAARWIKLTSRRVYLAPHGSTSVGVSVAAPTGAAPGDYLSGISVQARGDSRQTKVGPNVAVSSVQRYAVGAFVHVPGERHPSIDFTGASVGRAPAGTTFFLRARNGGNVVLEDVRGSALVTQGKRTVARTAIGPGTFVTGTSIALPLLVPKEQPQEGTRYRVRAFMRYRGGIARLDTYVTFGHKAAVAQQQFGGPPADDGGLPWLLILAIVLGLLALAAGLVWWHRRRLPGPKAIRQALRRALDEAERTGRPVLVVRVDGGRGMSPAKLAEAARTRLRRSDAIGRLNATEVLILCPTTSQLAAEALGVEIALHMRSELAPARPQFEVVVPEAGATVESVLERSPVTPAAAGSEVAPQPVR